MRLLKRAAAVLIVFCVVGAAKEVITVEAMSTGTRLILMFALLLWTIDVVEGWLINA